MNESHYYITKSVANALIIALLLMKWRDKCTSHIICIFLPFIYTLPVLKTLGSERKGRIE